MADLIANPMANTMVNAAPLRAKFEDLTESEVISCDAFLVMLTRYNRTDLMPTDRIRKTFWTLLFEDWDTNTPITKPVLKKRTAKGSSIEVGTLKGDCPVPDQATKRKRDGAYVLPATRRRGAVIFLQLSVDFDGEQLHFKFTDNGNSRVPANLVQLDPGYTPALARATLIVQWDKHEATRVSRFNEQLTFYWARIQLVTKLEIEKAVADAGDGHITSAIQTSTDGTQDASKLVKLATASDILEISVQIAEEMRRINNGSFPEIRDDMGDRGP